MTITPSVEIKSDSINQFNVRLTTFLIHNFPYRLIQEPSTHRLISWGSCYEQWLQNTNPFDLNVTRNSASTRAIPIKKVIEGIRKNGYIPTFTKNQPGMQGADVLSDASVDLLTDLYIEARNNAIQTALWMDDIGAHKQEINGILAPFMTISVLATATDWDNFFKLRCHPDAHPDFQVFAKKMQNLYKRNIPRFLYHGEWHLPFLDTVTPTEDELKISAVRNARLSYESFNKNSDITEYLNTYNKLTGDPLHGSPFEHNIRCDIGVERCANYGQGWISQRKLLENKTNA